MTITLDTANAAGPEQPYQLQAADTPLGRARVARGWSQEKAVRALVLLARSRGWQVASEPSLKVQLSGWEHGRRRPNETYRLLLCAVYRATAEELGFDVADRSATVKTLRERINDLERLVEHLTGAGAVRGVSA
ncbi:XRE family transcriptional regulator [Streptomyces durocortorensis]|uniref:XRE family transcriptional regulator n=1 Tax=Streptomyces durocortorensis TaxID=2811104 RepID=A0ABS2I8I6_9ACTN|nr:XRE family transcriptional regulator [Streptomyces durocortorensis]MBM7058222.1 XRE family transcriptional regulator [Streptomyces durocortorensis]